MAQVVYCSLPLVYFSFFSLCKKSISTLFTKRLRGASLLEENKLNYPDEKWVTVRSSSSLIYPHLLLILFSLCKKPSSNLLTKRLRGVSLLEENKLDYPGKNINIEQLFGSSSLLLSPRLLLFFSLCAKIFKCFTQKCLKRYAFK